MQRLDGAESQSTPAVAGAVLIVDDQAEIRRAFGRGLRRLGYTVTEAPDGKTAVDLARAQPCDVVVSDLRMPDLDGIELLRILRETDPDLPVVLMSGEPDLDSALKAVEYGAIEYLRKPVDLQRLTASVERAVRARRERVESREALEQYRSGERRAAAQHSVVVPRRSWSGQLLGGRYRVGRLIGEGGMGGVYEASREDLAHMRVAIKVLRADVAARADLLARFRREAELIAAIDHPNIVRILDFQATDGEPPFIVMERLHGESLAQAIVADGPFRESRAAFVLTQVLQALGAAHRASVIHRDLKPDNVFLTTVSGLPDIVKLLDFGVAKLMGPAIEPKLTLTGVVVGTPAYMAPEHARGADVDARSDLYAVGAMAYELLAGRPPFAAENYNALMVAIQEACPSPLASVRPGVDPGLARIVARAMHRDPDLRYQTAEELAEVLSPWLAPLSSSPSRQPPSIRDAAFSPTLSTRGGDPDASRRG